MGHKIMSKFKVIVIGSYNASASDAGSYTVAAGYGQQCTESTKTAYLCIYIILNANE